MTKRRLVVVLIALIGAVLGAALGAFALPHNSRYTASANVAMLPAPGLTTVEASTFWEVLTRGQITRTAAIVYDDPRWLPAAAKATNVPEKDLTLTAAVLPDTTLLSVTVTAASAAAAQAALIAVLTSATPDVTALAAPYFVRVLWPPDNSAVRVPGASQAQFAAAGALGGLLVGGGIGWLIVRRRTSSVAVVDHSPELDRSPELVTEEILPR